MPVNSQILHHAFERRPGSRSQFFAHIVTAKKDSSVIPARKREAAITQNYLSRAVVLGWMVMACGSDATMGSMSERA